MSTQVLPLSALLAEIPEDPACEALASIESIITDPPSRLRIRCHLTHEFRLTAELRDGLVRIGAPGLSPTFVAVADFRASLSRYIHKVDEAVAEGAHVPAPPRRVGVVTPPAPPAHMDLPVWDPEHGDYYDAEY